ncbi:4-hydroxybenzoate 3-monooxygenase [Nakamurella sp. PAMC28650]|uniref:4-hydroxybenzoate 3-monooxygenase n=1 Tax=Nakamurella sp. PAMC28650 TaxID=2762325 RepID=UPI00164DCF69|nr:4-hydroxybenzoate 3-monooxygenase [Nakamurella sp. PAMC28650]QNK80614.1 4-hydroxybenzoate 3-monooxygenase [Nakamurella sp. PAMC28650]
MRTQVAIIGAGPAGLLLSHLLARRGIESIVIENRSRAYVEARLRAGVLEQGTVDLLDEIGLGKRLHVDGQRHDGIHLQWPGTRHRIDFPELCGRSVWVYGQTEVVKDLIQAAVDTGQPVHFEVSDAQIHYVDGDSPSVTFTDAAGEPQRIDCDVIAGCDGFHGISRPQVAATGQQVFQREYPFSWLGILAAVPPSTDELIYAWHPNGFAMHSMRSPEISRLYLQVTPTDTIENWSDDRIWSELSTRMELDGWHLADGPVLEKGITPMRSFVSAPMRRGRLFLAGDTAHIVPPTGAKGLNLAVADVAVLDRALGDLLNRGDSSLADAYSETALRRVWRSTHFSWWMTSMLHRAGDEFDDQLQLSQLRYVASSPAAAASLAENYTGLPLDR